MNSILYLLALVIAIYFAAPVRTQDPWADMGVTCDLETAMVTIKGENGCSKSDVKVKYCRGTCRSGSIFQFEYPYFKVACNCCKALKSVTRPVLLSCPGGSYKVKWIKYAAKCGCQKCG